MADTPKKEEDKLPYTSPYLELPLEYFTWKNDPAARGKFDEIMKDLPLSNLTQEDAIFIEDCMELQRQLRTLIDMEMVEEIDVAEAIDFLQFLAYSRANVTLGINATARKLDQSHWLFKKEETKEPKRPSWGRGDKYGG